MIVHQRYVMTTFLNAELDLKRFELEQFEGFEDPKKACKLQKSLYGLKQSSPGPLRLNKEFFRRVCDNCPLCGRQFLGLFKVGVGESHERRISIEIRNRGQGSSQLFPGEGSEKKRIHRPIGLTAEKEHKMTDCKKCSAPLDLKISLSNTDQRVNYFWVLLILIGLLAAMIGCHIPGFAYMLAGASDDIDALAKISNSLPKIPFYPTRGN